MEKLCKCLPFEVDSVRYAVPTEYVGYIVSARDEFPCCIPPRRKPYVDRVVQIDRKLITIVELAALGKEDPCEPGQYRRSLILILTFQNRLIGLLTDRITSPVELSELQSDRDAAGQRTFLTDHAEQFILFDVPRFYREI